MPSLLQCALAKFLFFDLSLFLLTEIQAALHPFVPHASRYHDDVTRFHGKLPAFFAAELQCRCASINRQHFMRCAVIVMKGKHTRTP